MTTAVQFLKSDGDSSSTADYDAIVIGAGVSGLYQLYKLRELGLKALVLEKGSRVGGTWYWNRYPGARFDSESWTYIYSFSKELLDEWKWTEHFATQPETERYLNYVADKFDLRRDIQFGSEVIAAHYIEETRKWEILLSDGRKYHATFLITAIGILSASTLPRIKGVETFAGEAYHTAQWPHDPVNLAGKRVAVIGTGSTGVQTIQEAAKVAGHLTVFQRTPNWCAPLHNTKITDEEMEQIRARYPEIMARCQETPGCFVHGPDPRSALEVTPEVREAFFEKLYSEPGFGIWYGNFRDILVDSDANALISEFVARKIRERVKDPKVADRLIPKNHGFGTRRLPLETRYYEVYNQPNVELVDVNETPIQEITPTGIRTSAGEHEFDVIIYATGFNAITGAFEQIDIRGVGGRSLKEAWASGPQTYLGFLVAGFPNMMMVMGPHGGVGNFTRFAEFNANWVSELLRFAVARGATRVEVTQEAEKRWFGHVADSGIGLLSNSVDSWMTGVNSNVEGRSARRVMRYSGGFPAFRQYCEAATRDNYAGIDFD
ncbi:MAG: NAD(P)/FAD-dependent oxidoreductase [Phenylobacterium sp.]|uniref:flavin-containing monooxygenase n=1 Tax=Phenylobacterium sp. TaxID=1871053 RepID=UPI002734626A|nr:NAD(P)/FAD-dependent oxidoreductase [Phenylobacterium sp.]MDP3174147.1 NAD(P)/FAD-dependent oxidoreductase [Phenylobacterium sp.]